MPATLQAMAILIDPVATHGTSGVGNDTVPPGIGGLDWCHAVSDQSLLELDAFLTLNLLTIGCSPTNVRTPLLGSLVTYVGLTAAQYTAAVAAGATAVTRKACIANAFDAGSNSTYEP